MTRDLTFVFDGWDGYHRSLVAAIAPLTGEQLAYRPTREMRSVAEIGWHIADGRVDWFRRIDAPGSGELWSEIEARGALASNPPLAAPLVDWLNRTWEMIEATLSRWTIDDLAVTYPHAYHGKTFAVSRQWTVWRILTHDVHHGGQLSAALGMQGISPLELTLLGGHLTEPPLAS